jgi:copper(I)-binding protein
MKMEGGLMKMRRLSPGLVIKPGETAVLGPGGIHLMFLDLKQRPKRGVPVKGTLLFEKAGRIDIEYKVAPIGARDPGDGQPGSKGAKPKPGSRGHY